MNRQQMKNQAIEASMNGEDFPTQEEREQLAADLLDIDEGFDYPTFQDEQEDEFIDDDAWYDISDNDLLYIQLADSYKPESEF